MECLDENLVAALFERQVADAELDAIDEHVSKCGRCRVLLSTYAESFADSPPSVATTAHDAPAATELPPGYSIVQRLIGQRTAQLRIGTTLRGKWVLDALLGTGGTAHVYAASHRNGKRVAIKILKSEWAEQPELVRRFMREGYVANKIGHPGAISILDDDVTEDGAPFLVMELLEGETVGRRLGRGAPGEDVKALPLREVLDIADQVLSVLEKAHSAGIVHRDLKPDNLFMTTEGEVKILDFGTARLLEVTGEPARTQTGYLLGTPTFMPPEQARGLWDEVDGRSDLWSLGATMYTLLTGQHVRSSRTTNNDLFRAMTEPVTPIRHLRPDLPPASADLVDRALSFEIAERWPSASAMRLALRTAAAEAASLESDSETAPARSYVHAGSIARSGAAPSSRRRWPAAGAALVGVVALGALVYVGASASRPAPPTSSARSAAVASAAIARSVSVAAGAAPFPSAMVPHDARPTGGDANAGGAPARGAGGEVGSSGNPAVSSPRAPTAGGAPPGPPVRSASALATAGATATARPTASASANATGSSSGSTDYLDRRH